MTVIRVIHNQENPYVQLNKKALWDEKLSLKAVGLWARCLSRPDDWTFSVKELAKKCKEGRRAIDSAIHELIENGYAIRIEYWEKAPDGKFMKGRGGVEYVFFEFPATQEDKEKAMEKFKKSFRYCGFGNCRNGDSRNSNLLKKECLPKNEEEPIVCSSPPGEPEKKKESVEEKIFEHIKVKGFEGKEESLSIDDLFRHSILKKKNWTSQEITDCWKILSEYKNPIRDVYHFVEGTISKKRNIKKAESWNKKTHQEQKKATSSNVEPKSQTKSSRTYLDEDTIARIFEL